MSFVVLFSTMQNLGGLAGASLLGRIQTIRQRTHAQILADSMSFGDPLVAERLATTARQLAPSLPDAASATSQAGARLGAALQTQANVLAFNDTFWVVALISLFLAAFLAIVILIQEGRRLRAQSAIGAPS